MLAGSASNDGDGSSDTLTGIENLTGSSFDDTLTGDANANILSGGVGSDTINGGSGNDTLYAGIATSQILSDNPGVVYYDGSFYKISAAQAQYAAAETAAETSYLVGLTDPGYLVTVTSAGEDAFVQAIVDASDKVWIGASDVAANNNWQWVGGPEDGDVFFVGDKDSGTSFGYEGFEPGVAPDGAKDFAFMEKTKTEWFSETGTNSYYYITEWRAGTSGGGDLNTLNGGAGADQLYASDDIDMFVFDNNADAFTNPDTVNNFDESGGDGIDISDILSGLGVNAGNLSLFVDISQANGVRIDVTGSSNFAGNEVATFAGTTTVSDEAVLLASSQLII